MSTTWISLAALAVLAPSVHQRLQLSRANQRSETLRASWGASPETMVLLSVGRLAAEKNLDLTLKSYRSIQATGRNVKLVIAGDGPLRAATEVKCPEAIFAGMCTHQQLAQIYASADVLLFPSLTETFGNVTLESLASGTPVLAFDCAAAGEFILHDKNGWLVPIDEPDRYIQNTLNITAEKDRLSKTRTFARSSVEHLGWHEIAGQVESIFQRAIEIG